MYQKVYKRYYNIAPGMSLEGKAHNQANQGPAKRGEKGQSTYTDPLQKIKEAHKMKLESRRPSPGAAAP
jgi:hypothetical protein